VIETEGLTNKQQAVLLTVSSVLISIGTITIVTDPANPWMGIIIDAIGAIGFGIKEALGGKVT
jgi:hypothetical protein